MFVIFSHQQVAREEKVCQALFLVVCIESTFFLPCYSFAHEWIIFILIGLRQELVCLTVWVWFWGLGHVCTAVYLASKGCRVGLHSLGCTCACSSAPSLLFLVYIFFLANGMQWTLVDLYGETVASSLPGCTRTVIASLRHVCVKGDAWQHFGWHTSTWQQLSLFYSYFIFVIVWLLKNIIHMTELLFF